MAEPALKETVKHTDRQKENSQQADIISGRPTLGALRQGRRARARSPYLSRSSRFLGLACLGGPFRSSASGTAATIWIVAEAVPNVPAVLCSSLGGALL